MKNAVRAAKLISTINETSPYSIDAFALVSRPDPVSNIRVIRYHVDPTQSLARCQVEARRLRTTARWHEYWYAHNLEFTTNLDAIIKQHGGKKNNIPSAILSKFYADHLAAHRQRHNEFNKWWIKENFTLLYLNIKCWFIERTPVLRESGFFGP